MKIIYINGQKVSVTNEVYDAYLKGIRKFRYYEKEIKRERVISVPSKEDVKIIPAKEISYEQLIYDEGREFVDESENVEEIVIKDLMNEIVHYAIETLTTTEKHIVYGLFFENKPGRIVAKELGVTEMAICKRKRNILKKLRKALGKFNF